MGKLAHKYVQNVKKEKSNKFHGYPFLHGFRNLKNRKCKYTFIQIYIYILVDCFQLIKNKTEIFPKNVLPGSGLMRHSSLIS